MYCLIHQSSADNKLLLTSLHTSCMTEQTARWLTQHNLLSGPLKTMSPSSLVFSTPLPGFNVDDRNLFESYLHFMTVCIHNAHHYYINALLDRITICSKREVNICFLWAKWHQIALNIAPPKWTERCLSYSYFYSRIVRWMSVISTEHSCGNKSSNLFLIIWILCPTFLF